jgi:hypothetical protein
VPAATRREAHALTRPVFGRNGQDVPNEVGDVTERKQGFCSQRFAHTRRSTALLRSGSGAHRLFSAAVVIDLPDDGTDPITTLLRRSTCEGNHLFSCCLGTGVEVLG